MRKKIKTLLCAAAILGSMSATKVYALDIDTDVTQSSSVTYNEIVNVTENGVWPIENGTNPTTIEINDKLTNNGNIHNNASLIIKEIHNINGINGSDSSLTITNGGENQGTISQDKISLLGGTLQNNDTIKASSSLQIDSNAILNNIQNSTITGNLTNDGTINNDGNVNAQNGLANNGTINGNNGTLTIKTGSNTNSITQGSIKICNDFSNSGEIIAKTNFSNNGNLTGNIGRLTVNGGGSNSGSIEQDTFRNDSGEFNNSGTITTNTIINMSGAKITGNDGTLTFNQGQNEGSIVQNEININAGSSFTNTGSIVATTFNNSSNISGEGTLEVTNGTNSGDISQKDITIKGSYTNNGNIISSDNFVNSGTITGDSGKLYVNNGSNSGSITQDLVKIDGEFTNSNMIKSNELKITDTAKFTNNKDVVSGSLTNEGNIEGTGDITVSQGANRGSITQKTLTIQDTSSGSTFENETTGSIVSNVINSGNVINNGSIIGAITNSGNFTNNNLIGATDNRNNFSNSGTFTNTNNANIYANDFVNNATFTVSNNGNIDSNGEFSNEGTIEGTGSLIVSNGSNSGSITQTKLTTNGTFTNNTNATIAAAIENKGNFTNDGSIVGAITNSGDFTNNNAIGQQGATNSSITNSGSFTNATGGDIYVTDISNSGTFENNADISASGKITNNVNSTFTNNDDGDVRVDSVSNAGTFNNHGNMEVENDFTNSGSLNNNGSLIDTMLSVRGNFENTGKIENLSTINVNGNFLNNNSVTNGGILHTYTDFTNNNSFTNQNQGELDVEGNLTNASNATLINNNASINMQGSDNTLTNDGIIKNSQGSFINMGYNELINNGTIENDNSNIRDAILTNNNKITADNQSGLYLDSLDNDNGTIDLNGGSILEIEGQTSPIAGIINSLGHANDAIDGSVIVNKISTNDGAEFVGNLNIGDGAKDSYLAISGLNIKEDATVNVAQKASLSVGENATLNLNTGDTVKGDLALDGGAGQAGTINLNNFTLETGLNSTLKGGNQAYYSQNGGTLNLLNNSTLKLGDSSAMRGGDLNIDGTSQFLVTSEENGTIDSANFLDNLTIADGGRFGVMNGEGAEYNIENINVNNGTANFTIDVLGRSNAEYEHGTDQFIGTDINGNGTINIEDWTLAGDIFGWQAPIDRDIKLDNVFDYQNISPNVQLSATKKEVFTPIGWYQLNNHGGMTGNYELNLTRFNPQVYRGQVTTLAQYMNQLAIDDMLFNHSMLLPSFKDDDISDNGAMINRLASANPVYAPYQYSKKDGGLWYRMYGTFETLQMSQGLSRVGNNAYGTIIGADFGLKDLRNGWKFMPTAYIGYNGAHQYFAGMGAYQNGGQAGFLGTWYKNNFVLGGLIYGGVYQNSMDIAGHVDNTFNYFAGASAKGAYNLRLHRAWVLQPNLMLAYNFFGQQNWHSDFGQMGMMSGTLNGINLAPGLNLIWEKETFSIYATLQYMYNLNGAVDGRAGNVSLPHLYMDRGYIQYGFGFTKRFSDRFAGYFQTVFRNVGRTGVGFQLGLNIKLGK